MRWVIVNKGTREKPNIRCRLVGRGFADKGNRDDLFAVTPPLVIIRMLLSLLAKRALKERDMGAMVITVKGHFHMAKPRGTCIYIYIYIYGIPDRIQRVRKATWAS